MSTRFGILPALLMWGCQLWNSDVDYLFAAADTADAAGRANVGDSPDTDTGLPPGPDALLSPAGRALVFERVYWASREGSVRVDEDSVSGTLAYREWWNGGTEVCSTQLELSADTAAPDCLDCVWSIGLAASPQGGTGVCSWTVGSEAFDRSAEALWTRINWRKDYTDFGGDYYAELMTLQYESVDGRGSTQTVYATPDGVPDLLGRYDPETGALSFPGSPSGVYVPVAFEDCGLDEALNEPAPVLDGAVTVSSTLQCDSWDILADAWTVDARAGQLLSAQLRWSEPAATLALGLVRPDGCLVGELKSYSCASDASTCPSWSFQVEQTGSWTVVVVATNCADSVDYILTGGLSG